MKKTTFVFLFFGFLGAGFYYGSKDDTYAHKFFSSPKRFPANEAARAVQDIWEDGQLRTLEEGLSISKVYSPLSKPEQNVCDHYTEVKSLKISVAADASVSDAPVKMVVDIDCDTRGSSPIFLKSFCSEALSYFKNQHDFRNSTFSFENILDGFPRSWYIESADVLLRDGLSVVGVKPPQSDVKALGKYTFECSDL